MKRVCTKILFLLILPIYLIQCNTGEDGYWAGSDYRTVYRTSSMQPATEPAPQNPVIAETPAITDAPAEEQRCCESCCNSIKQAVAGLFKRLSCNN